MTKQLTSKDYHRIVRQVCKEQNLPKTKLYLTYLPNLSLGFACSGDNPQCQRTYDFHSSYISIPRSFKTPFIAIDPVSIKKTHRNVIVVILHELAHVAYEHDNPAVRHSTFDPHDDKWLSIFDDLQKQYEGLLVLGEVQND